MLGIVANMTATYQSSFFTPSMISVMFAVNLHHQRSEQLKTLVFVLKISVSGTTVGRYEEQSPGAKRRWTYLQSIISLVERMLPRGKKVKPGKPTKNKRILKQEHISELGKPNRKRNKERKKERT